MCGSRGAENRRIAPNRSKNPEPRCRNRVPCDPEGDFPSDRVGLCKAALDRPANGTFSPAISSGLRGGRVRSRSVTVHQHLISDSKNRGAQALMGGGRGPGNTKTDRFEAAPTPTPSGRSAAARRATRGRQRRCLNAKPDAPRAGRRRGCRPRTRPAGSPSRTRCARRAHRAGSRR